MSSQHEDLDEAELERLRSVLPPHAWRKMWFRVMAHAEERGDKPWVRVVSATADGEGESIDPTSKQMGTPGGKSDVPASSASETSTLSPSMGTSGDNSIATPASSPSETSMMVGEALGEEKIATSASFPSETSTKKIVLRPRPRVLEYHGNTNIHKAASVQVSPFAPDSLKPEVGSTTRSDADDM